MAGHLLPEPVRAGRRQPFPGQLERQLLHQQPGGVGLLPSFTGGDQQVLSAALSVYCHEHQPRRHQRAQHSTATSTTSLAGSGMDTYNVGTNGVGVRPGEQHHADGDAAPGGPQRQHHRRGGRELGGQRGLQRHQHVGNVTNADLTSDGLAYTPGPDPHRLRHQRPLPGRHRPDRSPSSMPTTTRPSSRPWTPSTASSG